ncbi:hypothetical protein PC9H_005660 [Pleurotus ostreatus]|uniref:Uncharacterized protein n=1 Tax=Pleurotus ostreatus TaxID=5322 RepID=A0A8H7A4A8_PLEOS|nr:uncharacterized protein PC9H_005660 [Pleurotus ostreatus]KAF7433697.1 hypothetical protein PC9H_005660 [Pleurotus ostreatus]
MISRYFIIDDADGQINYSPSWRQNGCSSEYQNTTHSTKAQGAFFTLNFVVFYSSPPLPYTNHTLVGTCADEGSLVWIDYFVVEVPLQLDLTSLASSPPTPKTVGVTVPAVLGTLLLLSTTLVLYLWCRLRQSAAQPPRPFEVPPAQCPRNLDVLYCAENHKPAPPSYYARPQADLS